MRSMLRSLALIICSLTLLFSGVSFANHYQQYQHYQQSHSKHAQLAQWDGMRCRMMGGFWRNGYWHPARRVCWEGGWHDRYWGGRCWWVGGFWRHGMWYPAHRVCR